ncbi:MAG TPA: hypothetical protein VF188_03220 [Longimicrobiales bacterium]
MMFPSGITLPLAAVSLVAGLAGVAACDSSTGPDDGPPDLWIGQHKVVLRAGEEARLTALYLHSQLSGLDSVREATWRSSNTSVLRVRGDGSVTAAGAGVATVSLEYRGERDAVEVRVVDSAPAYHTEWASVTVGFETVCAITAGGETYCWGNDYYGAVADGARRAWTGVYSPVRVMGGQEFSSVALGLFHVCALTPAGTAYCWGDAGAMIGLAGHESINEPRRVDFDRPFNRLAAGRNYNCGLAAGGTAYCWGVVSFGELGDGVLGLHTRRHPYPVKTELRFVDIRPGGPRTCALTTAGRAYCWGAGSFGELGNGSRQTYAVPVAVSGDHIFEGITGRGHTCGRDTAGTVHCWGSNKWHQIGMDGDLYTTPVELPPEEQFQRVIAGTVTTCGLNAAGTAYCWGLDRYGNLGAGGPAPQRCDIDQFPCSDEPLEIAGGLRFQSLSLGLKTSCGVTVDHALYCWGSNLSGQLGAGLLVESSNTPVRVVDPW